MPCYVSEIEIFRVYERVYQMLNSLKYYSSHSSHSRWHMCVLVAEAYRLCRNFTRLIFLNFLVITHGLCTFWSDTTSFACTLRKVSISHTAHCHFIMRKRNTLSTQSVWCDGNFLVLSVFRTKLVNFLFNDKIAELL